MIHYTVKYDRRFKSYSGSILDQYLFKKLDFPLRGVAYLATTVSEVW